MAETKKRFGRLKKFLECNIFLFRPWDSLLYLFCYLIIPIATTATSLLIFPEKFSDGIYCYVSIFICAINCMYDAFSRFDDGKSAKNLKLFIIVVAAIISAGWSLTIVIIAFVSGEFIREWNWIFLSYLVAGAVAFSDMLVCASHRICFPSAV